MFYQIIHKYPQHMPKIRVIQKVLRGKTHPAKGSPVYPGGQLQTGMWLIDEQEATCPHDPTQGLVQRSF